MTSPLILHATPAAGFDQPFEMLLACHERVERMLQLLERLRAHLAGAGADAQAQQAANDVMRYFDVAAPHHHEDEERHVFPLLRTLGQAALADRLHAEHEAMATAWAALRSTLAAVGEGRWDAAGAGDWGTFIAQYRSHIAAEEHDAYPPAADAIDAGSLQRMAHEMAQRRGVG